MSTQVSLSASQTLVMLPLLATVASAQGARAMQAMVGRALAVCILNTVM